MMTKKKIEMLRTNYIKMYASWKMTILSFPEEDKKTAFIRENLKELEGALRVMDMILDLPMDVWWLEVAVLIENAEKKE